MRHRGIFVAGLLSVAITASIAAGSQLYILLCVVGVVCGIYLFSKPSNAFAVVLACVITLGTATGYRKNIDNMYSNIGNTEVVKATAILLGDTWYLVDEAGSVMRAVNADAEFVNGKSFEFSFTSTSVMENDVEILLNSGSTIFGTAKDIIKLDEPIQLPIMAKIAVEVDRLIKKLVINTHSSYKGISLAMMFSERDYADDEALSLFRRTGIYHLTSVSGVHIAILLALIATFVPVIRKFALLRLVVFTAFGGLIFIFSGYSPSAFRAVSIACIHCIAQLCSRDSDGLNTLGISLLLIVWSMPWVVLSLGFYMSYCIYIGIVLLGDKMYSGLSAVFKKLLRKGTLPAWLDGLCGVFTISIICSLVASVFSVFVFGSISPFSGVVSMLTVPFMSPLLICGYIATVAMYLGFGTVAKIFMMLANSMAGIIYKIALVFDNIGGVYTDIYSSRRIIFAVAMVIMLVVLCVSIMLGKICWKTSLVLTLCLICTYTATAMLAKPRTARIILPRGTATLILDNGDNVVVVNGSSDSAEYLAGRLVRALDNRDISGIYDIRYLRSIAEKSRQVRTFGVDQMDTYSPVGKAGSIHKIGDFVFSERGKNHTRTIFDGRRVLFVYGGYGNSIDALADRLRFEPYDVIFTQNGSLMYSKNARVLELANATVIEFDRT